PPAPLAVAGPADVAVGQHTAEQAGNGAEPERAALVDRPERAGRGHAVLLFQETWQIRDVEVPAVRGAEIHQANGPQVWTAQQLAPRDVLVAGLDVVPASADHFQLGLVDLRFFFRPVAEPNAEKNTPKHANRAEEPERAA